MIRQATLAFLLAFSTPAAAHMPFPGTVGLATLNQAYNEHDSIALVRISQSRQRFVGPVGCGTFYTGHVQKLIKAGTTDVKNGDITFGRAFGLKVGRTYLLFLNRYESTLSEFKLIIHDHPTLRPNTPNSHILALLSCGGMIPGAIFDPGFSWPVKNGAVEVWGLWEEHSLPASIRVIRKNGPAWSLQADDVFRYLQKLGTTREKQLVK